MRPTNKDKKNINAILRECEELEEYNKKVIKKYNLPIDDEDEILSPLMSPKRKFKVRLKITKL